MQETRAVPEKPHARYHGILFNSKALLSQQKLCDAAVNFMRTEIYSGIARSSLR